MKRSLPIFGLGLSLALAGIALFLVTMRKPSAPTTDKPAKFRAGSAPAKRAEERAAAAHAAEAGKMRIAATLLVAAGATLMVIS